MKIHELVKLRNLLDESIALEDIKQSAEVLLQRISSVSDVDNIDAEYAASVKKVRSYYADMLTMLDSPPKELQSLHAQIDAQLAELTKDFGKRGYIINGFYATNATDVDGERNLRTITVTSSIKKLVAARIGMHSDWRYPGLEIGPGDGEWTELLVASDPLYLIDNHKEFLDNTLGKFNEEFQRRLRPYVIDFRTNDILALPHNQIGFAFAWNVFNFFPKYELDFYLKQVFELLRPGGVLLFDYNNCDNPTQAKYAEEGWMSWMPRSLLQGILDDIGFEVIQFFEPELNVSFVEVKKPGTKTTAKAHQVMGEIKFHNS